LVTEKNSKIVILGDSDLQRALQKNHDTGKTPNFEIEYRFEPTIETMVK